MAVWQADFLVVPTKENSSDKENCIEHNNTWININEIETSVENVTGILIEEKSWSDDIRQFGKIDSTCLELLYDKGIIEIRCRFDLRSPRRIEFESIINFVSAIKGVFCYQSQKIEASNSKMFEFLSHSDEARFCENPEEFIINISKHNKS